MRDIHFLLKEIKNEPIKNNLLPQCDLLLDEVNFLILKISLCEDEQAAHIYFDILDEIQIAAAPLYYRYGLSIPNNLKKFVDDFNLLFDNSERARLFNEINQGKHFYDERHDILLLRLLEDMKTEPIKADLSKPLQLLTKEMHGLLNQIKNCENIKEAQPYFYLLEKIQDGLAVLSFKYDVCMSPYLDRFITDVFLDRIDDEKLRALLFKQITSGEYELLKF